MCGIAGIVSKRPVRPEAVTAMTTRLVHRGPDGDGIWQSADRRAIIGHRRLKVIDLTDAADQPMADAGARAVVTYNGEIYNYRELRQRLRAEGAEFRSSGDTEVLLQAYLRWGEGALAELNGMFAFAILDLARRRLFCARDRFGEKPFYFAEGDGFFAFASEIKALLALDGVGDDCDPTRALGFLASGRRGLDDERTTPFSAVRQLLPGETMTVDLDTLAVAVSRYWAPKADSAVASMSEADAIDRFRDLLSDAVSLRLRSDVPLGSCLSGGLDSSAIVCLARRHLGAEVPYHVFSGRFPGHAADEGRWADIVATATAATVHISRPTADDLLSRLGTFAWANELPVGSASQYAQWCVFESAKEAGVTVLLDGQGGDEILGGYEQYFPSYLDALRAQGEHARADEEEAAIRKRYPMALPGIAERLKRALPRGLRHRLGRLVGKGSDFGFGLSSDMRQALRNVRTAPSQADPGFNPLSRALAEDALEAHLPALLRYGDRNSMAHSREVRLPFCDHRIAEFSFSLPASRLMGGAETKRLLRRAMAGILPEEIRTRWNKQGFLPPQPAWFKGALGGHARALFHDPAFAARGWWDAAWWRGALARFDAGEAHLAWTLWKPVIAEAWHRDFVERAGAMPKSPVFAE